MTDHGQIFTGLGRIVGPEDKATALAEAMNDLEMQISFAGPEGTSALIITRRTMRQLGVDHPVLLMPASVRDQWLNDPLTPEHLRTEYTGQLPTPAGVQTFDIVKPGDRHE